MAILARSNLRLAWPMEQTVPAGGSYRVHRDNADGVIDFTRDAARPVPAWPDRSFKFGWGVGRWGVGRWGQGAAGGFGWGVGRWGFGPWGQGAVSLSAEVQNLVDGTYRLAVVAQDAQGNRNTDSAPVVVVAASGVPRPAGVPRVASYSSTTDTLTLAWALSPDDQGY